MPYRNVLDMVSALKTLLGGDSGYFVAIVRAHLSFIKWWLFHKSKSVFPVSKKGKPDGMLNENMVWLHFIKKKKYFYEIVRQKVADK